MRIIKKFRIRMIIGSILGIALLLVVTIFVFINQPSFGRTPRGERLERIKQSPNYRNGEFQNLHETTLMTSDRGRFAGILEFLFRKIEGLRSDQPDSDRRKTNTSRSGILHGFPCFFRQQTF